ncbi:MAG TPA: SDR family oxidoreductase [Candidatus Didemnitutus sp.]|nr:SDR family oxidoreductase [Candidatus Didemnitutus sp.]
MKSPTIVVTGASQGLGAAIARAFATSFPGARLALVARSKGNLERVAESCSKKGRVTAAAFVCDVTDESAVAAMAAAVMKRWGAPTILVNNAGRFLGRPLLETTAADFDGQLAANLRSAFLVSQAFLPAMVKRRSGDVINISSIAGKQAYPNGAAYCAAKHGLTGLSAVMRAELKPHGIRVCCVHPGATWTPSWRGSGISPRRMMPAEDVADAIVGIARLGRRTVVEDIVLRPQLGDV